MSSNFTLVYTNAPSVEAIRNALLLGIENGSIKGFSEKKLEEGSQEWNVLNARLAYLESPVRPDGASPLKMRHQIPMMRHIGRVASLYPKNDPGRALLIDEVMEMCLQFRIQFGNVTNVALADNLVCETFQYLEQIIRHNTQESGSPWIVGPRITIADLEVASLVGWLGLPKFTERGMFDRQLFAEEFTHVRNLRVKINEHNFLVDSNARRAAHHQLCKAGTAKPGAAHTSESLRSWRKQNSRSAKSDPMT